MRILLVEDEPRIAAEVAAALQGAGYVVETVGDGEEAWFRGDTEDYDLVVLDYMMPYLTGMEVLEEVRKDQNDTKVLMLTAKAQDADREKAILNGADYFMSKPFSPMELLALVEDILVS